MTTLAPLWIGDVRLAAPVILAPMSGVTDMPFRRLVARLGAGMVVSEMLASREVVRASRRSAKMLTRAPDEGIWAVQLAGCEPDVMADAARLAVDCGADLVDINMGCPVKKVVNGHAGAALMRDEPLAARIMAAVASAVSRPVTLKMRTGWDIDQRNAPRLARIAEETGLRAITVHGRTRMQFYDGRADWAFIREVKAATRLPVIGNGDVASTADAVALLRASGADGVMVGRGACGRPWLLSEIMAGLCEDGARAPAPPTFAAQRTIVREHYDGLLTHYGAEAGLRRARKYLAWYADHLPGGAAFRSAVMRLEAPNAVRAAIDALYRPLIDGRAAA